MSERSWTGAVCPSGGCNHRGNLKLKFDGGRNAVLCEDCRTVLGYTRHTQPATLRPLTEDDYRAARDAYARAEHSYLNAAVNAVYARLVADTEPAPEPAPVGLPTVDEMADAILASSTTGEGSHVSGARAARDLIASRVPVWVPIEPGDVREGMTLKRTDRAGGYTVFTVRTVQEDAAGIIHVRGTNNFYALLNYADDMTWEVDPRTVPVPTEPEDPAVAVVKEWVTETLKGGREDAIRDLLARIDAARNRHA